LEWGLKNSSLVVTLVFSPSSSLLKVVFVDPPLVILFFWGREGNTPLFLEQDIGMTKMGLSHA
jgi:hypothetical protein